MDEREKELLRMILTGNTSAFEELIHPYNRHIFNLIFRLIGDREEAKDIWQESLLKAFKYLPRFNPKFSFRQWLLKIAVNLTRDFQRKKGRENHFWAKDLGQAKELSQAGKPRLSVLEVRNSFENKANLKIDINRCLNFLSPREKEIFLLRDLEGLSIKETAKILGCSSISVRVNLVSARKKIKAILTGDRS